jgi:hypothetical protein
MSARNVMKTRRLGIYISAIFSIFKNAWLQHLTEYYNITRFACPFVAPGNILGKVAYIAWNISSLNITKDAII